MPVDNERTQSLIRKLDQLLAKTHAKPLPERVHQIRTTARRLESVLDTLYPTQNKRQTKLRKRLRRLRRGAGGVRDVDVQIVALRKLNIGREHERRSRLMEALNDLRSVQEQKLSDELRARKTRKLRKGLQCCSAELAPEKPTPHAPSAAHGSAALLGDGSVLERPVIADPWAKLDLLSISLRRFARLSRQMRNLTPENLHAYRTECKRVRYVAEMAGDEQNAVHVVELLKRIQDVAGDWHDWLTLTATAESQFPRSPDSALISALRNVTNAKFMEARVATLEARKELMAEYRAMLARKRSAPAQPPAGKRLTRVRRPKAAARTLAAQRRGPKAVAAAAQRSGVA